MCIQSRLFLTHHLVYTNKCTRICMCVMGTHQEASLQVPCTQTPVHQTPSEIKVNRLLQLMDRCTMQNKYEGSDYHLTNNKGAL